MTIQKQNMPSISVLANRKLHLSNNVNWLLVIAVVSTFLNGLVISLLVFPAVSGPAGLENFGDGWAQIAENVVRGNGFVYEAGKASTFLTGYMKREPIYALFLALILNVFGQLDPYMMLLQALVNCMTCLVLYFIVVKTFNRRTAVLACFLYSFYPFASWYVPRIAYETFLGFLVALLTLGLVNLFEKLSFRRALTAGLMLGITVLCRGIFLLFPLALLPGLIIRFGNKDIRVIGSWITTVVAMLMVLSPWIMRNYLVSGEFVPVATHGGISYFIGNKIIDYYSLQDNTAGKTPDEEGDRVYTGIRNSIATENPTLSHAQIEVQVDRTLTRMAVKHLMQHPLAFADKILKGLVLVWFLGDTGLKSTALLLMQGPLLFFCAVGIFYALKSKRQMLALLTILLYFVLIQAVFIPLGRYSYPMVPILIAFAAYSLEMFGRKYLHAIAD